jgi:hypothetical protein
MTANLTQSGKQQKTHFIFSLFSADSQKKLHQNFYCQFLQDFFVYFFVAGKIPFFVAFNPFLCLCRKSPAQI